MTKSDEAQMQADWDQFLEQIENRYGPQAFAVVQLLAEAYQDAWDRATRRARPVTRKAKVD